MFAVPTATRAFSPHQHLLPRRSALARGPAPGVIQTERSKRRNLFKLVVARKPALRACEKIPVYLRFRAGGAGQIAGWWYKRGLSTPQQSSHKHMCPNLIPSQALRAGSTRYSQLGVTDCRMGGCLQTGRPEHYLAMVIQNSPMPKKPPCRRQGTLLTVKRNCPVHAEPVQLWKLTTKLRAPILVTS